MDPLVVILEALASGAVLVMAEKVDPAIKKAYETLKSLLRDKLKNSPRDQDDLEEYEKDPEQWKAPARRALNNAQVTSDPSIIQVAEQLLELINAQSTSGGSKYNISNTGLVQGQTIGDRNQVTQNFGAPPAPQSDDED